MFDFVLDIDMDDAGVDDGVEKEREIKSRFLVSGVEMFMYCFIVLCDGDYEVFKCGEELFK